MKTLKKMGFLLLLLALLGMMFVPTMSIAATRVELGTAEAFAVLAGTTVTNTGTSIVNGNLGLSPGLSVTGFPPGILNGIQYVNDAVSSQAQSDLTTAYIEVASRPATATISEELGGQKLAPGVYKSSTDKFGITGTLTLDGGNDPNAVFIFQMGETLITETASIVNLTNGAQPYNVFWQVGSSATLGTSSYLKGNVLALTSITATTSAKVDGRLLARNGAVTLDTSAITISRPATLHVIKHVINDNGGAAIAANFNLHVKMNGNEVTASPAPGAESPGTTYILGAGTYVVSEEAVAGYTGSFSGDGDAIGNITLASGDNKTITVTNNDNPVPVIIPPVVVTTPVAVTPPVVTTPVVTTPVVTTPVVTTPVVTPPVVTPPVVTTPVVTPPVVAPQVVATQVVVPPVVAPPVVTSPEVVTTTVTGGQLPETSTPWYNILFIGAALVLVGVAGWKIR